MTAIALIGAGRMAKVHAASIIAAGTKIATIYDPVEEAAKNLAAQWGGEVKNSAIAAMNDDHCDAIIIATTSDTHIDLLKTAIKTQKPILCEKPLSANFEQGVNFIYEIGEEAARKIFIGFNRRFDQGHACLRHAVHSGKIGALEQLIIISRDPSPPPLDYIPRSGGLFRDMMIHDFDMSRAIVNRPIISVSAHGSSIIDPEIGKLGDIDSANVTMVADDGTIIAIMNSRRCAFGFDQRIEAFGANGMIMSDNPRQCGMVTFLPNVVGAGVPILEFFMERYGPSYCAEISAFINCAEKGLPMPINAIDGIMAAYLAQAADACLKQGKTIYLKGFEDLKNLREEL